MTVAGVATLWSLWLANLVAVIDQGRAGTEQQPRGLGAGFLWLTGEDRAGAVGGEVVGPIFRDHELGETLGVHGGKGAVWPCAGENEELVRLYLDDSLRRGGYAAISTFHFGNPDFTHSEPFLHCYRGQIPYIALQDAHGAEPWWFADMERLAGFGIADFPARDNIRPDQHGS